MIEWLARGAILTAGGLMAAALLPAQVEVRWTGLTALFSIVALWLLSYFLRWDGFPTVALLGTVALAVAGVSFGLNTALITAALVLTLVGWDLDLCARRLRDFARVEGDAIGRHLRATAMVASLALGLTLLGVYIRFSLTFGLALLLAAAGFVSLVLIVRLSHPAT